MPAEILTYPGADALAVLERAGTAIREGRVIAFPTETVYGFAARADSNDAVRLLAAVKGRDAGKPFQHLFARVEDAARYGGPLSPIARALAEEFWPGPLTLVLPTTGDATIGMRVPDHPVARAVISFGGVPLAGTSANLAGGPPALTAEAIREEFGDQLALIVDGPPPPRGAASTVVEVRDGAFSILRQGCISREQLESAITHCARRDDPSGTDPGDGA